MEEERKKGRKILKLNHNRIICKTECNLSQIQPQVFGIRVNDDELVYERKREREQKDV